MVLKVARWCVIVKYIYDLLNLKAAAEGVNRNERKDREGLSPQRLAQQNT